MKKAAPRKAAETHDAYPLKTVAARTGLTPDLIRAWEKRYAVVAPVRGARGARLYSADDVEHLRLLARVVSGGRAIGDVAGLRREELAKIDAQHSSRASASSAKAAGSPREDVVDRILANLAALDENAVSRMLGDAIIALGTRSFVYELVAPLVTRAGDLWSEGRLSIAAEHLLTAMLRSLIGGLIQRRMGTGRPLLLATPPGERHELGLMLVALLAVDAGASVVYLGVDLPAEEIVRAAVSTRARIVGLSVVSGDNRARAADTMKAIQKALPKDVELWVGGADAKRAMAALGKGSWDVMESLEAGETRLRKLAGLAVA